MPAVKLDSVAAMSNVTYIQAIATIYISTVSF